MEESGKTREELLAEIESLRADLARLEGLGLPFRSALAGDAEHGLARFLSASLETTGVLVSALDREHRFVFWNRGAERITGYRREEVLGGNEVLRAIYPDEAYRREVVQLREEVMQGRPTDGLRLTVRTKGGEVKTLAFYSRGVFDERGEPLGLVNVAVDVTESARAEEALRASEARFRTLFESMTEGVALHELVRDASGTPVDYVVTNVNPAYERHTGIRPADAIGRRASDLYGAGEPPYLPVFARVATTGEADRLEVYFEPMGRYFRILVFSPGVEQFATVFEDITASKRLEAALRETNAALQARNAELDAYAHTVAHDLKNPVSALLGFAEHLQQGFTALPEQERADCLGGIAHCAQKMSDIVDDLLLIAETRQPEVPSGTVDVGRVVAESLRGLEHLLRRHEAQVIPPGSWPAARGHAPWVERVFTNYLSNAVKYGGRPPRVELGADEPRDGRVRFWVRDNGDGVAPEERKRLFTPFTRLAEARVEGHGLGLAIVRRLVERMGGEVSVESTGRPGEGSTFAFTLPGE